MLNETVSQNTRIEQKNSLQGIERLVPHRTLPLNLNAFRLLRLLRLLRCRLVSYSDEVLPLPAEEGFDIGNVFVNWTPSAEVMVGDSEGLAREEGMSGQELYALS